jgi:peptidoglycan/xylan/chitin deacetylase (PgdA/CDA1 family)
VKDRALRLLTSEPVVALMRPLTAGVGTILMFHRFADAELGNPGHAPELLREHLAYLRRTRRELISVAEMISRLGREPDRVGGAVAFTVDDGYADFARVGARLFAEFDCPVTVFLVTGVLDGHGWYWWDRLHAAFTTAATSSLEVRIDGAPRRYAWADPAGAAAAARSIADRLKTVREAERVRVLADVEAALRVDLPARPPARYAPMTWDDVRACARRGVTFGPHTVTHPLLSRVEDEQSAYELLESWRRVRAETAAAVPIFCYPNGERQDFGDRECALLAREGFEGAITTIQRYVSEATLDAPLARFRLPRFPYYDDRAHFLQIISGLERLKRAVRTRGAARSA